MAPQPGRAASPFGVTAMSVGGFDSLTDKYNFAAELAGHDRPTETSATTIHPVLTYFWPSLRTWRRSSRSLAGRQCLPG
jgi:hypothetical protein